MADEDYTFTQARARLEEIVSQVRRKDVSLEKSLDLLEEGVRLANSCTERIDHTEWRSVAEQAAQESAPGASASDPACTAEVVDISVVEIDAEDMVSLEVAELDVVVTCDEGEGSDPSDADLAGEDEAN